MVMLRVFSLKSFLILLLSVKDPDREREKKPGEELVCL